MVKLLGKIGSPDNSRRLPEAIVTDPTLSPPALAAPGEFEAKKVAPEEQQPPGNLDVWAIIPPRTWRVLLCVPVIAAQLSKRLGLA